jgi:uncharacterized protein
MENSMVIFFLIAMILTLIWFLYLGFRLISWRDWQRRTKIFAWFLLSLPFVLMFLSRTLYLNPPSWMGESLQMGLQWTAYLAMGVLSLVFFGLVAIDLSFWGHGKWKRWKKVPVNAQQLERRIFFNQVQVGTLGLVGGASLIGFFQAVRVPAVKKVEVFLDGLPEELEGFTIAQLTDVHVGPTIKREWLEKVVKETNAIGADLIALTGDLVDGFVSQLREEVAPFGMLKAPFGVYGVLGNHEYYWGALEWVKEFERIGVTMLNNENVVLEKNGKRVLLGGVTDYSAGKMLKGHETSPRKAIQNSQQTDVKILLAHQPKSCFEAERLGFDLQLSGHTHAGQYYPWRWAVALVHPFIEDLNRFKKMWVYVNSGTGYWGPPLRFGVPSEITQIVFKRKQ